MTNKNNETRPTRNPSFSDGEPLSPEIQAVIDGWCPQKMERAKLANVPAVLETVRECVAAAKPTNPKMARSCLRTTTEILLWAHEEFGYVDVAEALNPHNIEYFIAHVSHGTEPGGQSNTRWILRRVARAVCPTGMPAKAPRYGRSTVAQPYTEPDEEVFRFMVADSDASNRAGRLAVVALSLGAGLRGDEVAAAMPNDLEFRDDGRIVVNVRGDWARRVPVRATYTALVAAAAEAADGSKFVEGSGHSAASCIAERLLGDPRATGKRDGLALRRARNTWLVAHLRANTPLGVLRVLAGQLSAKTLNALLDYISAETDPDEAVELGMRL